MVRTFSETWDYIESLLQSNAVTLGIDAGAIKKGDRETPARAPFLTVYLIPSATTKAENGTSGHFRATCIVFAGVRPAKTLADSIKSAVDLAGKVLTVSSQDRTLPTFMHDSPIEFDEDSSIYTAVSVTFEVPYKLL
jgi:hypothetical protein